MSVIDGQTSKVIYRIAVAVEDDFWLALDPRTNTLYVTNEYGLYVDVIDLRTDKVTAKDPALQGAVRHRHGPATDTAYGVVAANRLFVIDGQTNTVTAKITVGNDAFGVADDPATGQAFVANTVTVVNGRDAAVAGSVTVGRQPFIGLAADPHRGIVYVTNNYSDSVSVLVPCPG